ncbi:MAG: DUF481 domain-containing protein [Pirellulales bacterium]|nr:DUF481 domain-containing protein [Pirellulales bacterium]
MLNCFKWMIRLPNGSCIGRPIAASPVRLTLFFMRRSMGTGSMIWLVLVLACTIPAQSQEPGITPLLPMDSAVGSPQGMGPSSLTPIPGPTQLPMELPSATAESIKPMTYEDAFAPAWYQPAYWFGPTPWDTSIEVGINGSDGTCESMSMRVGGTIDRKTDWNQLDVDMVYNQTSSNNIQTQNNAMLDARHDWFLGESPWTLFISTSVLYDEFQAFDLRWAANGGVGYQLIETERANLIGRFGAGTSREFGGPDERWVPEALFGAEYKYQINRHQKFAAKVDYFPDWEDYSSYRLISDIGWEMLLDAETNMSLKLSVIDRYDSTPNGAEPHLLNYAVLLLWKI